MAARVVLSVLIALAVAGTSWSGEDLKRGVILDPVASRANPAHSYAVYLPSNYSADRRWPLLLAFDPGARGALPVQRYKDAAERLGVIVVGSNNSRNAQLGASDEALNAMLSDASSWFSLDRRRVYLTGFSGGARVAVMAGLAMQGKAAGVIGFGAGFPLAAMPTRPVPFLYFGAAGTEDFNYPELQHLDQAMDGAGIVHRIDVFEGPHDWPPPSVCGRALQWMELQAMKAGGRPPTEAFIDQVVSDAVAEASADEKDGRGWLALLHYQALARDLSGLRDVSAWEEKARDLSKVREVKSAQDQLKDSIALQDRMLGRIHQLTIEALAGEDRFVGTHDLLDALRELKTQANDSKPSATRMAARRADSSTWVWFSESARDEMQKGEFSRAAERFQLMARMRPASAGAEYNLACALNRAGRTKDALAALSRAADKGLSDAATLERAPDLESLRGNTAFQQILEKVRKAGK